MVRKALDLKLIQAREMNRLRGIETDDFQIATQYHVEVRTVRQYLDLLSRHSDEKINPEYNNTDGMRRRVPRKNLGDA